MRPSTANEATQLGPRLDVATRLAFERTRLAHERTMMAWVRTATSLITFGFSIYKFFQLEQPHAGPANRFIGPRGFALMMVSIGLGSLLLATAEHRQGMQALRTDYPDAPRSTAAVLAGLIAVLGIVALVAMIVQG
jgi:putative membrane protein